MDTAALKRSQGFDDQIGAEPGEALAHALGTVVGADFERARRQHGTGVEALIHAHDGDAGSCVSREDGALNRRGAAPTRQQRGMDVDTAELRQAQRGRRQQQTVGNDDERVELQALEYRQCLRRFETRWLMYAKPMLEGECFDGTRVQRHAAPGRAVRLGEYGADSMCPPQRVERRNSKLRRAGETQPQGRNDGAQGSKSRGWSAACRYAGGGRTARRVRVAAGGPLFALLF